MYYEAIRNMDNTFSVARVYENKDNFEDVILLPEVYESYDVAQLAAAMFTRDLHIVAGIFADTLGEHALMGG